MAEATIILEGHAEELAVFGSRDQHLRQIRDALGIKVLARHGEVRVEGEANESSKRGKSSSRCGRSIGSAGRWPRPMLPTSSRKRSTFHQRVVRAA